MRNTKAKKLMRQAEEMTVGMPDVAYLTKQKVPGKKQFTRTSFRILSPESTRGVYQNLKKHA